MKAVAPSNIIYFNPILNFLRVDLLNRPRCFGIIYRNQSVVWIENIKISLVFFLSFLWRPVFIVKSKHRIIIIKLKIIIGINIF